MKLPSHVRFDISGLHLTRPRTNGIRDAVSHNVEAVTRTVVQRTPSDDSSSSSSTCAPGNNSGVCEKPTTAGNGQTLPIVLGAVYVLLPF